MYVIQAVGIRLLFWGFRCLPVRLAGAIGAGLGRLGYHLDKRHRDIARRNLARIYPEKNQRWRGRIARESFAELGRTVFEIPHVFLRSRAFLHARVQVEGEEALSQAMGQGRGVFLVACHHSNWELGAMMLSLLGHKSAQIYRPLRQAAFDSFLKHCRGRFGTTLHARSEGMRWMPRALKQGFSIGVMIDQHLSNGVPIPFLGHIANTTTLPAAFACKNGTPVFGVALHRLGRDFRFRLQFLPIPPLGPGDDPQHDPLGYMQTICESFSPVIHTRPELWLWMHRRWRILDDAAAACEVAHGAS
jgi:KDO2-lipid IV(A) lauroyltransferase